MDKYFQATKSSKSSKSDSHRFKPYTTQKEEREPKKKGLLGLLPESDTPSSSTVTKLLLTSLKEDVNPITHSDLYERTAVPEHLVSMASGHQVSDGRKSHHIYHEERRHKLSVQKQAVIEEEQPQIFQNIKVYIDGYLEGTTDIEMKRIISLAGGQILYSASGATHILSSQPLSGSKNDKLLNRKSRVPVQVVKPEWVFDSIKAGKRQPERKYSVMKNNGTVDLAMMMQVSRK